MKKFNHQKRILDLMEDNDINSFYGLAQKCNVDRSTVTRWMRPGHELKDESVRKICETFSIGRPEYYLDMIDEYYEVLKAWHNLSTTQKEKVLELINCE